MSRSEHHANYSQMRRPSTFSHQKRYVAALGGLLGLPCTRGQGQAEPAETDFLPRSGCLCICQGSKASSPSHRRPLLFWTGGLSTRKSKLPPIREAISPIIYHSDHAFHLIFRLPFSRSGARTFERTTVGPSLTASYPQARRKPCSRTASIADPGGDGEENGEKPKGDISVATSVSCAVLRSANNGAKVQ
jgi:hypothetical protein